jgi:hypothetical protein
MSHTRLDPHRGLLTAALALHLSKVGLKKFDFSKKSEFFLTLLIYNKYCFYTKKYRG